MDKDYSVSKSATLFVVTVVQFLVPFMLTSVVVALPTIGKEFYAGTKYLSLIEMVYMMALALSLLPIVRLADIYGYRKMFVAGINVMILSTIAIALSNSMEFLIIFRFIQGVGGAMITATSLTILSFVFPEEERGKAFGVTVSSVFLGLVAGPTLSGFLITLFGWRSLFILALPIELLALILALVKMKSRWIMEESGKLDWVGTFIYIVSLSILIFGATHLQDMASAKWLSCAGFIGMILFVYYEYDRTSPLLNVNLILSNFPLLSNSIATGINYACSFGLNFFLSIYLQTIKGISPNLTGILIIIQASIQVILAPVAGRLSDKYNPGNIAAIGMTLCTSGLFLAVTLDKETLLITIIAVQVIMGLGFSFFVSPNLKAVMSNVEKTEYGLATGFVSTVRYIGMITSMTVITIMLSIFLGDKQVVPQTAGLFIQSMKYTLIIFCAMNFAGIFLSLVKQKTQNCYRLSPIQAHKNK